MFYVVRYFKNAVLTSVTVKLQGSVNTDFSFGLK